jgi:hypothetical protein
MPAMRARTFGRGGEAGRCLRLPPCEGVDVVLVRLACDDLPAADA